MWINRCPPEPAVTPGCSGPSSELPATPAPGRVQEKSVQNVWISTVYLPFLFSPSVPPAYGQSGSKLPPYHFVIRNFFSHPWEWLEHLNSVIWMDECILLTNIVYLLLTQAHRTTDQLFVYYRANCSGNQSLRQHSLAEVIQKAHEMAVRLTLARVYVVSPPYWFHGEVLLSQNSVQWPPWLNKSISSGSTAWIWHPIVHLVNVWWS